MPMWAHFRCRLPTEVAATNGLAAQGGEPDFYLVQPRGMGGGKVKYHTLGRGRQERLTLRTCFERPRITVADIRNHLAGQGVIVRIEVVQNQVKTSSLLIVVTDPLNELGKDLGGPVGCRYLPCSLSTYPATNLYIVATLMKCGTRSDNCLGSDMSRR
jgi:hypothetical protein